MNATTDKRAAASVVRLLANPRTVVRAVLVVAAVAVLTAATMAATGAAVRVLEVAAAVVVGSLAMLAVISLATASLLALAVRRGLRRMPPIDQLGRPFEASHDDVRVADVRRTGADEVVLDFMYGARRVVLLDEQGAPLSVETTGPATSSRAITGASALSAEQVAVLQQLSDPVLDLSLVERGTVTVGGPVTQRWELRASNGTVVLATP
jgi:hypothetical protein